MSIANDLLIWSEGELENTKDTSKAAALERLRWLLEQSPDPASLPVGSTMRQLAERRVARLLRQAEALGYESPTKDVKKEVGLHLAGKVLGIGL
ncbi:MAG: hypothetical protein K0041_09030 [Acidithiobacillus sp.]|nr:hypothetical protein [Acidithiobacillus sp.]